MFLKSNKRKSFTKTNLIFALIVLVSFVFLGWGNVGHKIINYNTILSALPQMEFFETWADSLEAHASDADYRKSWDPDEAPKHFIDIDNYPEFIATGRISQDFDSLVAMHGYSFVMDQGILPWAILKTADSIQTLFEMNDMHKAMLVAADLGHYIGDAHNPLHITRNYNGQYTNQYGVHSRYESTMIQNFQSQIVYEGDTLQYIDNLPDFVFEMIYDNYQYVDSVLYADSVAEAYAGNHNSTTYYNKFWEIAKGFTIGLFQRASYKLTCIIYTEWINAGSSTGTSEENNNLITGFNLYQNYPNPFNPSTKIKFTIPNSPLSFGEGQGVRLVVYDILGNEIATLVNEIKQAGSYEIELNTASLPSRSGSVLTSGIYFYTIQIGNYTETKKMVMLR